ncbi:hypothetical protein [Glaciecola petra]|uniref:PEP-CTERM sorting domain-containing protein n=1 Tax=Glaciecola petra TaxID=3075602 RepID=A0ABU2ZQK7_9ALTE|nr:hypothetical protein [Aestuariibacter sp. P117]MDT0594915.1 hypothetical protein [Aestuariibacter sp. P117]
MKTLFNTLFCIVSLLYSAHSIAALVEINVDNDEVLTGQEINVTITGSNFGAFENFDLFSFDVILDANIFQLNESSISSDFNLFDPFFSVGLSVVQNSNVINFTFIDFFPFDPSFGEFNIASFSLTALMLGESDNFGYSATNIDQGFFPPLSIFPINVTSNANTDLLRVVPPSQVSSPTVIILLLSGLIALWFQRRC